MKTFTPDFISRLNSMTGGGKLIILAEFRIDSSVYRYYTSHEEGVIFDGITYSYLPMSIENFSSNTRGQLPGIEVKFSNLGNEALELFETYNPLEKTIIIRIVNLEWLSDPDSRDASELMIIAASVSDSGVAGLILGLPFGTDEEVPREVYTTKRFPGIPNETRTYGI